VPCGGHYRYLQNGYGESRRYVIYDVGRDPNSPQQIFDGYLEPNQSTAALSLYQVDITAHALYQRSDGPQQNVDVSDGDTVTMS
jgi:hypothetical protein